MKQVYKNILYETMYGEGCILLDDYLIKKYISHREKITESSKVQGIYSDEGLYDFFASFSDYKRVQTATAKKVIGWEVINYMLNNNAQDPVYNLNMMDSESGYEGRADTASYGGTIQTGDATLKGGDKKYMKEMENIISELGWDIVQWMGIGPNRKSQVIVIPTKDQIKEDIVMRIQFKEAVEIKEQENNIKKMVAVFPGRFQPFGPHHLASYKFLKKRFDEVYIATSNKKGGERHPMSFSEKKKHMISMGIPAKSIVQEKQPYIPKGLLAKYDGDTTAVVFAVGMKDEGRLTSGKYFLPYRKNYNRLMGFEKHGYTLSLPHTSIKVGKMEISGTTMRKLLGSEKFDLEAKEGFFKKMFGYFDQKTFDLFTSSFQEAIDLDVSVGDTILVGKFKNKKMKVKNIGKDKHNMPTINGRKATTFRYVKEPNIFKERKELLLMGGAYGHMAHPFDDYALTFGELKDIIDLGLQGKLDKEEAVTEKLDGQNLMISMVAGEAVAARNKGDLKRGGMSLKQVAAKFKNHIPAVRNAFVYSMKDIKTSIEKITPANQLKLFNEGKHWVNLEIIYPATRNVIDYDGPATIIFHGILKYSESWAPKGEIKGGGKILADMVNKLNGKIKAKFAFKGPNIIKMHKDRDYDKNRQKYIGSLNKLQNMYILKDSDELSLWHQHYWLEYILNGANSSDYANIPDNVLYPLMKRWAFSDKSLKMTEINKLKEDHPEFVEWVRTTEKLDHQKMLKNNMKPFEKIFFSVGAEILANASNYLSVNPNKTAQTLRSELDAASKALMSKKDFSNIDKLKAQLAKLKAMPNLSKAAPTEGLVFKYNDKVYKFTGFFAPINQILGLEKFSR